MNSFKSSMEAKKNKNSHVFASCFKYQRETLAVEVGVADGASVSVKGQRVRRWRSSSRRILYTGASKPRHQSLNIL